MPAALNRGLMFAQLREAQHNRRQAERAALTGVNSTWRFFDQPLRGWVYRTPDDLSLQRGITFTILPDGRRLRVPRMQKVYRDNTENDVHDDQYGADMARLLADMLGGRKRGGRRRPARVAREFGKKAADAPVRHQMIPSDDPIGHPDDLPRGVVFT